MPDSANRFMVSYVKGQRDYNDALKQGGKGIEGIIDIMIKHTRMKNRKLYGTTIWAGLNLDG